MPRIAFRRVGLAEAELILMREDAIVLDVRDAKSFAQGHIERARNVSMTDVSAVLETAPKHSPILIYCYHGNASQEFAQIFSDFRFREVYSLDGGFDAWSSRRQAPRRDGKCD